MESCSKDSINRFPDDLLSHILSFLSTKEAASTSVLSKRWRYLLAFVPSLEFDDSVYLHPERRVHEHPLRTIPRGHRPFILGHKPKKLSTSFPDFVDRILALQGKTPLHKFSLRLVDVHDPVYPECYIPWIHNALSRGVSDLDLIIWVYSRTWEPTLTQASTLTRRIFLTETLVRLRINISCGPATDFENVHLPKLKILDLGYVYFESKDWFNKLLSGCPVLEELVLNRIFSRGWDSFFSVSVTTLKRLTIRCLQLQASTVQDIKYSVSLDTPNLAYLEYAEITADQYPKVKFDSLVEAKIDLLKRKHAFPQDNDVDNMVGNATDFIMGICNVRILYLSANTIKVLTFCCKAIPIFRNLTHLTIESKPEVGWESLPRLLMNCPKLETLVFQGLCHKPTSRCGDLYLCNREEKGEDVSSCLSSSPVKVLKIFMNTDIIEIQIEQINHFLKTMPNLEQVVLHYDLSFDEDAKVSSQLQMLTEVASPKCKVQLIPSNLRVSSYLNSTK